MSKILSSRITCEACDCNANAMDKKNDIVHRALIRLRLLGFLDCDLPFSRGEVTNQMTEEIRKFTPLICHVEYREKESEKPKANFHAVMHENGIYRCTPVLINLLNNMKGKQMTKNAKII